MAATKRAPLALVAVEAEPFRLEMPISLDRWRGKFAGAVVVYDADRVMGLPGKVYQTLAGRHIAEAARLDARRAALLAADPPAADLGAQLNEISAAHEANNDDITCVVLAHVVIRVEGLPLPDPDQPESWRRVSFQVRRWLTDGAIAEVRENLEGEFRRGPDRDGAVPGGG